MPKTAITIEVPAELADRTIACDASAPFELARLVREQNVAPLVDRITDTIRLNRTHGATYREVQNILDDVNPTVIGPMIKYLRDKGEIVAQISDDGVNTVGRGFIGESKTATVWVTPAYQRTPTGG